MKPHKNIDILEVQDTVFAQDIHDNLLFETIFLKCSGILAEISQCAKNVFSAFFHRIFESLNQCQPQNAR